MEEEYVERSVGSFFILFFLSSGLDKIKSIFNFCKNCTFLTYRIRAIPIGLKVILKDTTLLKEVYSKSN